MKPGLLHGMSPFGKLIFLLMLVFICFLVFYIAGIFLAIPLFHVNLLANMNILTDYSNPVVLPLLRYFQLIQGIGVFILPCVVVAWLFDGNVITGLDLGKPKVSRVFLWVFLLGIVSTPLINWMTSLNEALRLPAFLHGLEEWMKSTEDQAAQITRAFLGPSSVSDLLINLGMIALIPALGEEMLFRGLLQKLFSRWFRNVHVAIFLTAFIFAAIHMQFYGILPRFFLGVVFGYLFYWSGSLWVPVFAHFLNNAAAVIISFFIERGMLQEDADTIGANDLWIWPVISVILTVAILCNFARFKKSDLVH